MESDQARLAAIRKLFTYNPLPEFDEQGRLIKLDLAGQSLTELPLAVCEFSALQELRLGFVVDDNGLRWEADIRYNKLARLPEEIGNLQQLRILTLGSNRLASLPASFGHLSKLEQLDLQNNPLGTLPEPVYQLRNLQYLKLTEARLTSLSGEIGQLQQLQSLILNQNRLTDLPPQMAALQKLEVLNLSANPWLTVPAVVARLAKLRELRLFGCTQLGEIAPEIMHMPSLEVLWVKHNLLEHRAGSAAASNQAAS